MANEIVNICGDNISIHNESYNGVPGQRKDSTGHKHYLYATRLTIGEGKGIRGTDIDNIKIPVTERQYHDLKQQFQEFGAKSPKFVLKGNLEISIEEGRID